MSVGRPGMRLVRTDLHISVVSGTAASSFAGDGGVQLPSFPCSPSPPFIPQEIDSSYCIVTHVTSKINMAHSDPGYDRLIPECLISRLSLFPRGQVALSQSNGLPKERVRRLCSALDFNR